MVCDQLTSWHGAGPLTSCNGGDRDPARDAVPPAEAVVCDRLGIAMAWGVGGDSKADSSSRINEALGICWDRRGILVGVVVEALQVAAFVLIAIAAVFASLFFVWRDDHKWLDRPRY